MAAGYRLDDVCGDDTYCGIAKRGLWSEALGFDDCARADGERQDDAFSQYFLAPAVYRKRPCADGSSARCTSETNAFTADKVGLESALRGLQRAGSNKACPASLFNYADAPASAKSPELNPISTSVSSRQGRKSCGTISDAEVSKVRPPLPGQYHAGFSPLLFQRPPSTSDVKLVTLATARHPEYHEMKAESDRLKEEG